MANHSSAKKALRQTIKRTLINKSRLSRIRTYIKKVNTAIENNLKNEAMAALVKMQSEVMKGVIKGIIKKNAASRKISRLAIKINKIQ